MYHHADVNLSVWGYRETQVPQFLHIADLATTQNTGSFKIVPSLYKNRTNTETDILFGFIQMNTTRFLDTDKTKVPVTVTIWSEPIPLAWYFAPQWEQKFGKHWAKNFCDRWIRDDEQLPNFREQLPKCPCSLYQALADKGQYMSDFLCDKDWNPKCLFHRSAVHCVRTPNPTLQGEQQCCYDRNYFLMLSQDQQWGSYPKRSHSLGYPRTKVPTLSQWYHDIVPRFVCCLWQSESSQGCEILRHERRPTQDCVNYESPGIAGVYGNLHIITFDDLEYTFTGKGEFVLVRSSSVEVQGRFEQVLTGLGEVRATELTSVVARENSTMVVEVRRRPKGARWRYHLDVLFNGRRVYFDRNPTKVKHLPGVTVYVPSYIFDQSEVVIMFESGLGVEVIENKGCLMARVYVPRKFINQTRGLLGNWSYDISDDFTLPNGTKTLWEKMGPG
ncbi:hypothetical protein Zmor_027242 [Zophobas morio]|uniref:AMOP domain-containing protein n=1 Tax=Zophobas morio TaxID=2755281 RepID=A0AA38HQE5_9CUCU|nr:hypothetical protein Zmor_027242 [Zophobas morio]